LPANPPTAGEDTSPPAGAQRPLRRWSVAELIARAVAAPPPTVVSYRSNNRDRQDNRSAV
jgi:hypothetical protein